MKKIVLLATLLLPVSPVLATDTDGKALHEENCTRCHDSGVYTRADRFVSDRDALTKQVKRCELNLGLKWFDEDVNAVVDYLDRSYYKFGAAAQ